MNTSADDSNIGEDVEIRVATEADLVDWNAFVETHEDGSFFHRFEWQEVFTSGLGHKSHYMVALRGDTVVGLMPLVEMKSVLFGHNLSSLPFATFGGPLGATLEIRSLLESSAVALARKLNVGSLEFRYRNASGSERETKLLYEKFSKPIDADPEVNMKAIRSKQRNIIRKGIKAGLTSHEIELDAFYSIYSESVRNLGTPVFSKRLFREIRKAFPDSTEFFGVSYEGRAVSAAMNFYFKNEVCPYYWGGKFESRRLSANDFLAWEIINRAASRGCRTFDFGRSKKDTGSYKWKLNLGFEPSQLHYEYELIRDREMPNINPGNPKYHLFVNIWKRLPLPVSEAIGPFLSRSLG